MNSHYYNINIKITIGGKLVITQVKSIEIEKSIDKFSDTAKIELPRGFRNLKVNGTTDTIAYKSIFELINKGDTVVVEAGYNGELVKEFEGYISSVGADIPLILECEDEMYRLKKLPKVSKTFSSCKLKDIVNFLLPNYQSEVIDMDLGKFMIDNATPFDVFERLKKDCRLWFYFKGEKLIVSLLIDLKPHQNHDYVFGINIRKSTALKFETNESRKVLIKVTSPKKGKENVFYEYGEKGGDEISINAPLNMAQKAIEQLAKNEHKNRTRSGYSGTVDGWAIPLVQHGDTIDLKDPNYPDQHRDGRYLVESVKIVLNETDGFKRQSKLSYKLSK
ncbi:hypothetical protein ACIPCA_12715 [Flavobacterium covae]|uniref:hypothetical protein n=1 Tax=Flavobacterium covae TaxID=2906076 RepID=UPI0039A65FA1